MRQVSLTVSVRTMKKCSRSKTTQNKPPLWFLAYRDHQITMDDKEMGELKQKIEKANKLREMWKHVAENLDASALSYQACERLMHKLKARMDWLDDYYRENDY